MALWKQSKLLQLSPAVWKMEGFQCRLFPPSLPITLCSRPHLCSPVFVLDLTHHAPAAPPAATTASCLLQGAVLNFYFLGNFSLLFLSILVYTNSKLPVVGKGAAKPCCALPRPAISVLWPTKSQTRRDRQRESSSNVHNALSARTNKPICLFVYLSLLIQHTHASIENAILF